MAAISRRLPAVAVAYTSRGQRKVRQFSNAFAARRFYVAKDKAGARPAVVRVKDNTPLSHGN